MILPNKVLPIRVISKTNGDIWPYDEGDDYWSGGSNPLPYTWIYELEVSSLTHSSTHTRNSKIYDGLDVFVGHWMSDENGKALKITKVLEKSSNRVLIEAEDVERYNTFQDPSGTGQGSLTSNTGIIFELDEEGLPKVDNIPATFTHNNLFAALYGRFQCWNPDFKYLIKQLNHNFVVNDVVVINPNTKLYEKYDNSTKYYPVIGTAVNSFTHRFYIRPLNRIIENIEPALPSGTGNYVFVDSNGDLTASPTNKRVYIQLSESSATSVTGTVNGPVLTVGSKIQVSDAEITTSTTALSDFVSAVNSTSSLVTASTVAGITTSTFDSLQLAYGVTGAILPLSASINGTLVTFTTDTEGSVLFGMPGAAAAPDMALDINNANIPNITAEVENNGLKLTNSTGGSITITNGTSDASGYGFAGSSSCTGLPLTTPASTDEKIKLTRVDGGEIFIKDLLGTLSNELGLVSVQNGHLPKAMVVENWNYKSDTFTVNNIAERDSISPIYHSDEVMVLDSGNGEWAKYMYTLSGWILIADEDSANTDANTISKTITYNDSGEVVIGTVSDGSRINNISVTVKSPFDGAPMLDVGYDSDHSSAISDDVIDLTMQETFVNTPSHVYNEGNDIDIKAYFTNGSATSGELEVVISYS